MGFGGGSGQPVIEEFWGGWRRVMCGLYSFRRRVEMVSLTVFNDVIEKSATVGIAERSMSKHRREGMVQIGLIL